LPSNPGKSERRFSYWIASAATGEPINSCSRASQVPTYHMRRYDSGDSLANEGRENPWPVEWKRREGRAIGAGWKTGAPEAWRGVRRGGSHRSSGSSSFVIYIQERECESCCLSSCGTSRD
jgi:hypothetical protein